MKLNRIALLPEVVAVDAQEIHFLVIVAKRKPSVLT